MSVLYFFESIRNPVLDWFMQFITDFGGEELFIVAGLLMFWCFNKREGYYLITVGLLSTVVCQFLKILCRIPRPWVIDSEFTIVESARAGATGYSFPSGHSSSSVALYGSIARWQKQKWVKGICIAFCVLVPVSRMYLGVHTPKDILVGSGISLLMLFALYPLLKRSEENPKIFGIVIACAIAIAIAFTLYISLASFPADINAANLASAKKSAWTLLGVLVGVAVIFIVDELYLHFDPSAVWWAQIIKSVLGAAIALAIKSGLKAPLNELLNGHGAATAIRYFLMVVFAGVIWPMMFPLFKKLGAKKEN